MNNTCAKLKKRWCRSASTPDQDMRFRIALSNRVGQTEESRRRGRRAVASLLGMTAAISVGRVSGS